MVKTMYDTLRFVVDKRAVGRVSAALLNRGTIDTKTGEMKREYGGYKNFRTQTCGNNLLICGSLAKFYFGNNLHALTAKQTREAIEQLSDETELPLHKVSISRIDLGPNLELQHPVSEYLSLLGAYKDYIPVTIGDKTRYYWPKGKHKSRPHELCLYDKIDECINNGTSIPCDFAQIPNLLRYEHRLTGRLPKRLGVGAITGSTLYQSDFFAMMGDLLVESYFDIEKRKAFMWDDINKIKTVSEASEALMALLIANDDKGHPEVFLRTLKERRVFHDPKYLSRLKQKLSTINSDAVLLDSHDLIKELDSKVTEAVEMLRC